MHRIIAVALIVSIVGFRVPQASGQILGGKDAPIVYGHHHLNATNIDEHKKFWVDTLGGTAIKAGTFDVVVFPNVLIFLNARTPSGPTKGSSLNHIGFSVPNLRQVVDKIKANGYVMVTAEEAPV
jgi:predicted enzyme related to lactoylglutathione lyase